MNPKQVLRFASIGVLAALFACADAEFSAPSSEARIVALTILPQYQLLVAGSLTDPVNRVRLTAREEATGHIMGTFTQRVDPEAAAWQLDLAFALAAKTVIRLSVELINEGEGTSSVQWSGVSASFPIAPAETVRPRDAIDLFPGPLENLSATAITVSPDSMILTEGATARFLANVVGPQGVQPIWAVSDPTIARIDRTGNIAALRTGITFVYGLAGPRADSARLRVIPRIGRLDLTGGDGQTAVVNQSLRDPLKVRVLDPQGGGIGGLDVAWVANDNGRTTSAMTRTNDQGVATNVWQLGTRAGAQTATACVALTACVSFRAIARPDRASAGIKKKGDGQVATVGTIAGDALILQVTDQFGNGVPGAAVTWTISGGGGLSASNTTTDVDGLTTVTYTVSTVKGQKAVIASVVDGAVVVATETFRINAKAGKPDARTTGKTNGDEQQVTVAQVAPKTLEVTVRDSFANAVEGAVVRYALRAPGNSATLSAGTSTTDADGKAGVMWSVGTKAGIVFVDYFVLDTDGTTLLASGEFRAHARPGPPVVFDKIGDGQSGPPGQAKDVAVEVKDQFSNGVDGLTVAWAANQGNVNTNQTITDETGRSAVRWTLGNQRGSQSLTATIRKPDGALVSVQFSANAN